MSSQQGQSEASLASGFLWEELELSFAKDINFFMTIVKVLEFPVGELVLVLQVISSEHGQGRGFSLKRVNGEKVKTRIKPLFRDHFSEVKIAKQE